MDITFIDIVNKSADMQVSLHLVLFAAKYMHAMIFPWDRLKSLDRNFYS